MKPLLIIVAVALGLLLLACAAWAVQGMRWAFTGSRHRRRALATA